MAFAALLSAILTAACSSGGGNEDNFQVFLTDAPMMGMREVNVTIASVRVHRSASAGSGDAGWRDIPVTAPMPVDLLRLRGGVLVELCGTRLDPGSYQQVRLTVTQNPGANPPYHNSVVTVDGVRRPLEIPSDIKLVHFFPVGDGTSTDLRLDFDAQASMRQHGNGDYFMQPVIHASSTMH